MANKVDVRVRRMRFGINHVEVADYKKGERFKFVEVPLFETTEDCLIEFLSTISPIDVYGIIDRGPALVVYYLHRGT